VIEISGEEYFIILLIRIGGNALEEMFQFYC
jgi:hypothetical protein